MLNFLKKLYEFIRLSFFPPFCLSCEQRLITEKILCSDCSVNLFAFWEFESDVVILAHTHFKLGRLCDAQKKSRHFNKLQYALFLKALLELDLEESVIVIEEDFFEVLKGLGQFFDSEKFNHMRIYTDKKIVFLGRSLQLFTFYKSYFEYSGVKSLKAIFLNE